MKPKLVKDIDCLASTIMDRLNDYTIELLAMGIAQFLLLTKGMDIQRCLRLIKNPKSEQFLRKLIDNRSDFLGPTPRSIGIDESSELIASKIQQSLDAKHMKKTDIVFEQFDRIRPQFKVDLLYTHPTKVWIRFYSKYPNVKEILLSQNFSVFEISENLYELYCFKQNQRILYLLHTLETRFNADLIFCSELSLLLNDPLLFLSNYVKFMWCYTVNRNIFDPKSCDDLRTMLMFITHGLLFLNTNNISNMPKSTHGPLIACSGERPKIALAKFDSNTIYNNEGSRAMQTLNKSSDFGTVSNYIECITEIKLHADIDNIV